MVEETPSSTLPSKLNRKRKRQAEESSSKNNLSTKTICTRNNVSYQSSKKRGKLNKNGESVPVDAQSRERKGGIEESISKMDGRLLVDYFMQKAKKHNKELTAVELNDLQVPEQAFLDTTSFESRTLDKLSDFLKAYSPSKGSGLSKSSKEKGTPHTLVIASAGLRAADLVRALRPFQSKEVTVAKLFAKHIKLEEAKKFVQQTRINIGVGTPTRLIDLIESETLKLHELERIVIDGSYIDQKKRGIFDMKEMHFPLLQLLTRPEIRKRYRSENGRIQILVF